MASDKQRAAPPKVDAILLCDHVHKDGVTDKHTLIGVWDSLQSPSYPARFGSIGLYLNLIGLNGTYRFSIIILAPDLSTVVARFELAPPLVAPDPLHRHEVAVDIGGITFPAPGRSTVRFLYNGLSAQEFTLTAFLLAQPPGGS